MSKSESISFVFANAKGEPGRIISQLKRISNIASVTPVTGRFDLVIKLNTNELTKAYSAVEKIRSISGITSTQTACSIESVTNPRNRAESKEPPLGYALVKIKGGIRSVLQKLKTFPNLVEAHLVPGEFDVVASFNGFSQDELMESSVGKLNSISGITASETLISWTPSHTTQA
jgi:DNA-binding Lrp family transcriptional regulator